jgi:cytochrome c oxidase subunit IV
VSPMRRHRLDLFSLLAGLIFLLVAGAYLADAAGVLTVRARYLVPLVLIALGSAGLIGAVHGRRRRDRG